MSIANLAVTVKSGYEELMRIVHSDGEKIKEGDMAWLYTCFADLLLEMKRDSVGWLKEVLCMYQDCAKCANTCGCPSAGAVARVHQHC